jgi:hypothetical protein
MDPNVLRGQGNAPSPSLPFQVFPDPKSFRPERFLNGEGNNLRKSEELIPFGLGKRQCLGESLARMELFIFFANIFNRYKVANSTNALPVSQQIHSDFAWQANAITEPRNGHSRALPQVHMPNGQKADGGLRSRRRSMGNANAIHPFPPHTILN